VITAASTVAVLAAYDVLVRRANATRFVFGLAPLRPPAARAAAPAAEPAAEPAAVRRSTPPPLRRSA
jgi:hypothetical protein